MNAQTEKASGVHASSRKPTKKVCDENETKKQIRKKTRANVIHGRKPFIMPKQKTGENDLHELLGNNCGYNEGTICAVNGELVLRGCFFEHGRTKGAIKLAMAGTQDWWRRFPPLLGC